jgi:putative membrane protein
MGLLTPRDRQQIEAAIARAEQQSAGELVVVAVRRSAEHALMRAIAALLLTVGVALVIWRLSPGHSAWLLLLVLLLSFASYALLGLPALHRLLLVPQASARAAHLRACAAFAEHGLHRTRDRTGVLIFISELERRVIILADDGIDKVIGSDGWRGYVERLVAAIKSGDVGGGVAQVIDDIGAMLAGRFPRRRDDVDELPDEVIEEP